MTLTDTPPTVSVIPSEEPGTPPTTLPRVESTPAPPHDLRRLAGWTSHDLYTVSGAALSALCTTRLLFGILTPLGGPFGFVVVAFALFVVIYAFLVSLTEDRPAVVDKVMTVLMASCAATAIGALATVVVYTLWEGRVALGKANLFVEDMSTTGPLDPLDDGGIAHAIVGSLLIMALCLVLTVPLGLACAVYLTEARSRTARIVRTVVDAMTALPSIVAGLFIFATFVLLFGLPRTGLTAALAVSIVMLPIIIRASDVVLRLVPGNLREAAAALGAPRWRIVWFVVLPTARSGLATAVILGVARGIGETAPVLVTAGSTKAMNLNLTENPMMSLPLATFEFVRTPSEIQVTRGFATAGVLMFLVLVLFAIARVLGGRPAGQQTKRQARRTAARSARDAARFDGRAAAASP